LKVIDKVENFTAFGNNQEFSGRGRFNFLLCLIRRGLKLSFPLPGGVLPTPRAAKVFRSGAVCLLFCEQFVKGLGSILIWKKKRKRNYAAFLPSPVMTKAYDLLTCLIPSVQIIVSL